MSIKKALGALAATGVAATALVSGTVTPANAEWDYYWNSSGVNIRTGPSQNYSSVGKAYPDQFAWARACVTGQTIYGYTQWEYLDHYLANGSLYSAGKYVAGYYMTTYCQW